MEATCGVEASQRPTPNKTYHISPATPNGGVLYRFMKRSFDILVGLVGSVLFALPMALIALAIRLDSPGPALYRQQRLGLGEKTFTMYKFRSMNIDAEAAGPRWAMPHDTRVTRVGRFLRNSHLDELPQLWNILFGSMSLVGPRPERPCFYKEFETYIHGFRHRLLVKPGLTGLAQINGGYELRPEEKILYDMRYIESRTLLLDLKCILKTFALFFTHDGAR